MFGYRMNSQPEDAVRLARIFQSLIDVVEEQSNEEALVYTMEEASKKLRVSLPNFREHYLKKPDFPQLWSGKKCVIPRKALGEWLNDPERWKQSPDESYDSYDF
ncbi:putative SOS response-associated peptidase YedK [Croceifilum oryzae]|uniref:SOS response-associated peptidase YedK n=1 Tax=Croceifilum oryzae TaxID=1553429 RepID=A0AAJ1TG60_9BACL|nr:hypothetical protein [Croceifilum oryzae]MDQ0417894.1 putative SOS response-associated peptidase YedK [Croceifilum oryzae]